MMAADIGNLRFAFCPRCWLLGAQYDSSDITPWLIHSGKRECGCFHIRMRFKILCESQRSTAADD